MKVIKRLPLDKYVTNSADKRKPKYGDIVTWLKYDFGCSIWREYKKAIFGTPEYNQMANEFNYYYNITMNKIYSSQGR